MSAPACPWCGSADPEAEFVDIGVGFQQVTPYTCGACLAQEFSPHHDLSTATDEERKRGWWRGPTEEEWAEQARRCAAESAEFVAEMERTS